MRGIDVACVVFLVGHQFDPVLFVGNHVTETVALRVLGQSGDGERAVRPLLGNLLVLGEDPLLFQLQLQGLTLGNIKQTGVSGGMPARSWVEFLARFPKKGFYSFALQHSEQTSRVFFYKGPRRRGLWNSGK